MRNLIFYLFIPFITCSQLKTGDLYELENNDDLFCGSSIYVLSDSILLFNSGCENRQIIKLYSFKYNKLNEILISEIPQNQLNFIERCYKKNGDTSNMDYFEPLVLQSNSNEEEFGEFYISIYDSTKPILTNCLFSQLSLSNLESENISFSVNAIDKLKGKIQYFKLSDFKGSGSQYVIKTNLPYFILFYFMFSLEYSDIDYFKNKNFKFQKDRILTGVRNYKLYKEK